MMRRTVPIERLPAGHLFERGLTPAEARERRQRYGANNILEAPPGSWRDLVRDTARDPMLWFLTGASALYGIVGEATEALTLLGAIVPLAGMDAFLHRRTRASTEGLKSRLAERAIVMRGDSPLEIPAVDVVPGDLAVVAPGQAFPADGLVVGGAELQVDESALTGEAYPVAKQPLSEPPRDSVEPLIDHERWGFAGTRLLTGRALVRVVFTGGETLYGEIVRSAAGGARARTPLQGAIQSLVWILVVAASVVCLALALVRLRQGYGWVDAVISAVTLGAAALPEEFPVVFTFFLGVGVYRLAKRQALVRRAVVVENIGRVSVICSDKTGTITEGQLHLTHVLPSANLSDGELLFLASVASRGEGDPLDTAILREAAVAGTLEDADRLATFPFTEGRKRETAIVRDREGRFIAAMKGAVEVVLAKSTLVDAERAVWDERVLALTGAGHKVIACAWRLLDEAAWKGEEPDEGYQFAGLLALEDPVRAGVAEAVEACRNAGIHTIMVTGDHPLTARAVAQEIGLGDGRPRVITGDDLEARVARGEGRAIREVDVVARAAPSQKLALVQALRDAGEIVAVTGDGVNDVPALQAADIGIAMGERGTQSAREVAAIVLLDDNFRTVVRAIDEGRQLYQNLRLSFQYLLLIHIPLVMTAALIPLAGYPLLYLPVHVVWLELIIHPTALLVFQGLVADGPVPARPDRGAHFFSPGEWAVIATVGGLLTALVTAGYVRSAQGGNVEHGRAMALMTLTLGSAAVTAVLSRLATVAAWLISGGTVALSVTLIQTPVLAQALRVLPLHPDDWGAAVAGALIASLPLLLRLRTFPGVSRKRRATEGSS